MKITKIPTRRGMKVSWQVTGIRQDAYAKANPILVEENKSIEDRGYYLHPTAYGLPEEKRYRKSA